jgi:probable HAF family extracellular repeat protein
MTTKNMAPWANKMPAYTFTILDDPSGTYTVGNAINASGEVVGIYRENPTSVAHGFLYSDGTLHHHR